MGLLKSPKDVWDSPSASAKVEELLSLYNGRLVEDLDAKLRPGEIQLVQLMDRHYVFTTVENAVAFRGAALAGIASSIGDEILEGRSTLDLTQE